MSQQASYGVPHQHGYKPPGQQEDSTRKGAENSSSFDVQSIHNNSYANYSHYSQYTDQNFSHHQSHTIDNRNSGGPSANPLPQSIISGTYINSNIIVH